MSGTPWVRFFWSDYNADTAHLDLMQLGAYQRLMGYIYQRRQPLPGDVDKVYRIAHATSAMEQTAVRDVLVEFFMQDEDPERGPIFRHLRIERELERAEEFSDMAKERARKAAKARWGSSSNAPSNASSKAKAVLQQCHPEPEPEPEKRKTPPTPPRGGVVGDIVPDGVAEEAWADFVEHRKEIRKPLTARSASKAANLLREYPPEVQHEMVNTTIVSRWTGIFPPKQGNNYEASGANRVESRTERNIRIQREIEQRAFDAWNSDEVG